MEFKGLCEFCKSWILVLQMRREKKNRLEIHYDCSYEVAQVIKNE